MLLCWAGKPEMRSSSVLTKNCSRCCSRYISNNTSRMSSLYFSPAWPRGIQMSGKSKLSHTSTSRSSISGTMMPT